MSYSGVNALNNKIQQLFASVGLQNVGTASVFGSSLSNVSSDMIEKMLQQGMSTKSIVSQLIAYANTDDSDISKVLEEEMTDIVSEIENEIKQNSDNNSSNSNNNETDENPDTDGSNVPQNTENTEGVTTPIIKPIEEDYREWNISDTGTLFRENITQK